MNIRNKIYNTNAALVSLTCIIICFQKLSRAFVGCIRRALWMSPATTHDDAPSSIPSSKTLLLDLRSLEEKGRYVNVVPVHEEAPPKSPGGHSGGHSWKGSVKNGQQKRKPSPWKSRRTGSTSSESMDLDPPAQLELPIPFPDAQVEA